MSTQYALTNDWFDQTARAIWDQLFKQIKLPRVALEVGSFEGASACYLIDHVPGVELHCIDTWQGGIEHATMEGVKQRFDQNTVLSLAKNPTAKLIVHQGRSDAELAAFISARPVPVVDFAYVDGSHQSPDVMSDAVMTFATLRLGGVMVFDDYLRREVKVAVDAFVNLFWGRLRIVLCPPSQFIVRKVGD